MIGDGYGADGRTWGDSRCVALFYAATKLNKYRPGMPMIEAVFHGVLQEQRAGDIIGSLAEEIAMRRNQEK